MNKDQQKRFNRSLKEITRWAESVSGRENRYQKHEKNEIQQYLEGADTYVGAKLMLWHMGYIQVGKSLLLSELGDMQQANKSMRLGINRMVYANVLSIMLAKKVGNTVMGSLDEFIVDAAITINMGLPELAQKYYHFILEALQQGYSLEDGHDSELEPTSLRYSAMVMTILSDWLGLPEPDLEKYALPKDPVWMHYAYHWKEPDLEKFREIVLQVCDVHLERIAITDKEFDSQEFDFNSPYEALYPVEILFVLRLREMIGLTNPEIDHPLMNTPYANITENISTESCNDLLLNNFLDAVRCREPEYIELWDNYKY